MENYGNDPLVFTTRDYIEHYSKVSFAKISGIIIILASILLVVWTVNQVADNETLNKSFLKKIIDNKAFSITLIVASVLFSYTSIGVGFILLTTKIDMVY